MLELRADCARCAGLCCVGPALTRSADFAIDKPAGQPCPNLRDDHRCGIHTQLRERGFPGCTVYDCFGAGQQTVQVTFGDLLPVAREEMLAAFAVLRPLHELLWLLDAARGIAAAVALRPALDDQVTRVTALTAAPAAELAGVDVVALRGDAHVLLREASRLARAGTPARDLRGADLIGTKPRGDLTGADLSSAYLIGADLRGATLDRADLIGADLRAADLRGADLSTALFLTQPQVNAAIGDGSTRLPAGLDRPPHWPRWSS